MYALQLSFMIFREFAMSVMPCLRFVATHILLVLNSPPRTIATCSLLHGRLCDNYSIQLYLDTLCHNALLLLCSPPLCAEVGLLLCGYWGLRCCYFAVAYIICFCSVYMQPLHRFFSCCGTVRGYFLLSLG